MLGWRVQRSTLVALPYKTGLCCGFLALQIVDMDVVYHTGFEMTINIMTSIQLPGASVKVPASAYMQIKRLSGRVRFSMHRVVGTLQSHLNVSSTSRMCS